MAAAGVGGGGGGGTGGHDFGKAMRTLRDKLEVLREDEAEFSMAIRRAVFHETTSRNDADEAAGFTSSLLETEARDPALRAARRWAMEGRERPGVMDVLGPDLARKLSSQPSDCLHLGAEDRHGTASSGVRLGPGARTRRQRSDTSYPRVIGEGFQPLPKSSSTVPLSGFLAPCRREPGSERHHTETPRQSRSNDLKRPLPRRLVQPCRTQTLTYWADLGLCCGMAARSSAQQYRAALEVSTIFAWVGAERVLFVFFLVAVHAAVQATGWWGRHVFPTTLVALSTATPCGYPYLRKDRFSEDLQTQAAAVLVALVGRSLAICWGNGICK